MKIYQVILTEDELNRLHRHLDTAEEHYEEYSYDEQVED